MKVYNFNAEKLQKVKSYAQGKEWKIYTAVSIRNELYYFFYNDDNEDNKKSLF